MRSGESTAAGSRRGRRWSVLIALLLGCLGSATATRGDFFDSDLCRLFGCVLVTNGSAWEFYLVQGDDGGRATLWASGGDALPVGTVETGTLEPTDQPPGPREGTALGIDLDGDGVADLKVDGQGGSGFLDAGDRLSAFPLTAGAQIGLAERTVSHSFWLASNVPFAVYAQARLSTEEGALAQVESLDGVTFEIAAQASGADGGLAFGGASTAAGFEADRSLQTLADLLGGPRRLFELTRPTATTEADLARQLVRISAIYHFSGYDLSQGTGELGAEIEYEIYEP